MDFEFFGKIGRSGPTGAGFPQGSERRVAGVFVWGKLLAALGPLRGLVFEGHHFVLPGRQLQDLLSERGCLPRCCGLAVCVLATLHAQPWFRGPSVAGGGEQGTESAQQSRIAAALECHPKEGLPV